MEKVLYNISFKQSFPHISDITMLSLGAIGGVPSIFVQQ
jgi:hypothetical protein